MHGLTSVEAQGLLNQFGRNELTEKQESFIHKIFKRLISPITLMLILAAVLSFVSGKDFDGYFIIFLVLINVGITFWQEGKADNAIEKLKENFQINVRVLRDGKWGILSSSLIVPGDTIMLEIGNIVSADIVIIESTNFSVNEAAVTGESLPSNKDNGKEVYSGAFVVTGRATAKVKATGKSTYFAKTLNEGDGIIKKSILEKDILRISYFLSGLSLVAVLIVSFVLWWFHASFIDIITLDLSLVIAGIPISLPTVMTLIISLGVLELSKKNAVVRRISSLEDLSNVNLLLSDKTGTLTKNLIGIEKVISYESSEEDVLRMAFLVAEEEDHDPINEAIRTTATNRHIELAGYERKKFIPADSTRKRSTLLAQYKDESIRIEIGAPQVILELSEKDLENIIMQDVAQAAKEGFRVLAVATSHDVKGEDLCEIIGILLLSDELRVDTKSTLDFLSEQGVTVAMVTGDHRAIAMRVAGEVGIPPERVYAEVLPRDKVQLVTSSKEAGFVVASTGDGINDLPAMKAADVGIAVSNAVDALKSSADIVLTESGLSVIKDAIIESRKIFQRLWTYSVYRISESFRIIITIAVLGIIYHTYPLMPVQLILLALLNDLPIIALSYDRVKLAGRPSHIDAGQRIIRSSLFGFVGVVNSLLMFYILTHFTSLSWGVIQTIFFLKLTISGHLLIYLAHTDQYWWRFLPSKQVIITTTATQFLGTLFAAFGIFMTKVPLVWILVVWVWAFIWMQIGEWTKQLRKAHSRTDSPGLIIPQLVH